MSDAKAAGGAPAVKAEDPKAEPKVEETKAEKASAKKVEKRSTFHVPGPGSVRVGGKTHGPGTELELTEDEAESLGESVAEGAAPPKAEDIAKRKGGRYKVAGPGCVWFDGRMREKGFELTLSEEDARSLGAAVTPAR